MTKPILKTLCSTLVLTLTAGPVLALSCARPDAAQSFQNAASSTESYVILSGTFSFEAPPETPDGVNIKEASAEARFEGLLLTGNGFTDEVAANVTVNLTCLGEWCGGVKPDTPYLAFVEQSENTLTWQIDPCNWSAFETPTQEMIDTITTCAGGGDCATK